MQNVYLLLGKYK